MHVKAAWVGYIQVALLPTWKVGLVAITRGAQQYCLPLQEANPAIRGLQLSLYRKGSSHNSPLVANLEETPWDRQIPPAPPIGMMLAQIFDLPASVFGAEGQA